MAKYSGPAQPALVPRDFDVTAIIPPPPDNSDVLLSPSATAADYNVWLLIRSAQRVMAPQFQMLQDWGFQVDMDLMYDPVNGYFGGRNWYETISNIQSCLHNIQFIASLLYETVTSQYQEVRNAVKDGTIEFCFEANNLEAYYRRQDAPNNYIQTSGLIGVDHQHSVGFLGTTPIFLTDSSLGKLMGVAPGSSVNKTALIWFLGLYVINSNYLVGLKPDNTLDRNALIAAYGPSKTGLPTADPNQMDWLYNSKVLDTSTFNYFYNRLLAYQKAAPSFTVVAQFANALKGFAGNITGHIDNFLKDAEPYLSAFGTLVKVEEVGAAAGLVVAGGAVLAPVIGGAASATVGTAAATSSVGTAATTAVSAAAAKAATQAVTGQNLNPLDSLKSSAVAAVEAPVQSDFSSFISDNLGSGTSSSQGGSDMGFSIAGLNISPNLDAVQSAIENVVPTVSSSPLVQDVSSAFDTVSSFVNVQPTPQVPAAPTSSPTTSTAKTGEFGGFPWLLLAAAAYFII